MAGQMGRGMHQLCVRFRRLRKLRHPLTRAVFRFRLRLARRPTLAAWGLRRRLRRAGRVGYDLELITIAFNNVQVVELQREMLRRHVLDRYHWTVADNSSSRRSRRALRSFCRAHQIAYLRVPRNPYTGRDPSRSHAEALNHVANRYAGSTGAPVVGLLDHDVFPVAACSPTSRMEAATAYGFARMQQGTSYLWPGLLFLRSARVDFAQLDFQPTRGGDTGAGLAPVYDLMADDEIVHMGRQSFALRPSDNERYEVLDDWLHVSNASYWRAAAPKEGDIVRVLSKHEALAQADAESAPCRAATVRPA